MRPSSFRSSTGRANIGLFVLLGIVAASAVIYVASLSSEPKVAIGVLEDAATLPPVEDAAPSDAFTRESVAPDAPTAPPAAIDETAPTAEPAVDVDTAIAMAIDGVGPSPEQLVGIFRGLLEQATVVEKIVRPDGSMSLTLDAPGGARITADLALKSDGSGEYQQTNFTATFRDGTEVRPMLGNHVCHLQLSVDGGPAGVAKASSLVQAMPDYDDRNHAYFMQFGDVGQTTGTGLLWRGDRFEQINLTLSARMDDSGIPGWQQSTRVVEPNYAYSPQTYAPILDLATELRTRPVAK